MENKKHKFIEKAKEKHGNKYDYSKVEYKTNRIKVCIICPIHGEFWQTLANHTHIKLHQGCPYCKSSKLENKVCELLEYNNIYFERQKRFEWLGKQSLDFYLPKHNLAIECQGIQHFEAKKFFGGEDGFKKIVERDIKKYHICEKHNIKLIYYSNLEYDNVINDINILLKEINGEELQIKD